MIGVLKKGVPHCEHQFLAPIFGSDFDRQMIFSPLQRTFGNTFTLAVELRFGWVGLENATQTGRGSKGADVTDYDCDWATLKAGCQNFFSWNSQTQLVQYPSNHGKTSCFPSKMEVGGHVACARSFNFSVNLTDHFDLFEVSFLSSLDRASSFQILDLDLSGMKGISPGTVNCWMAKNMLKHDGFLVNFATASGCEWWRADLRNQRRRGGPSNLWCVAWCGTRWLVGWLVMNEGAINLPGLVMVLWTKP